MALPFNQDYQQFGVHMNVDLSNNQVDVRDALGASGLIIRYRSCISSPGGLDPSPEVGQGGRVLQEHRLYNQIRVFRLVICMRKE
jgi:hypothetical protein